MTLHLGDCLDVLPTLDAESIDAIVTDPPYDLTTKTRNGSASTFVDNPYGRARVGTKEYSSRGGFMGKTWDGTGVAFNVQTWIEAFRVAKPGAHLLAFGGTRTYHRLASAIEDAGWEIRDTLVWAYASGFPKSHNLNGEWQGWGTALKPAWEPIVLARKPLRGTVAANVQAYGTGALNIDGCRIGIDANDPERRESRRTVNSELTPQPPDPDHEAARWAAYLSPEYAAEGEVPVPRGRDGEASASTRYGSRGIGFQPTPGPRGGDAAGRWPSNLVLTDPIFDGDTPGVVGGGAAAGSKPFDWTAAAERASFAVGRESSVFYDDSGTYSRFFELPRGEGCYLCGRARPVAETSSQPSPSDASAPSPVATPPDGAQASMALEEDPDTENDTSGTATSTSPELPPVIVSPLRQPAKTAAQPPTSTGITTTIPDRWMCGPCADAVMHESTPPQPRPTRPALPVDGDDYTRFLIVPKSSRSDREPVLGGLELRVAPSTIERHKANPNSNAGTSRADTAQARANVHPTVKPTDLMRHLVRLVTPPGGLVLDPFMGSGTTALACEMEGFRWVGIEREAEYVAIAEARLNGTQRGLGLVG